MLIPYIDNTQTHLTNSLENTKNKKYNYIKIKLSTLQLLQTVQRKMSQLSGETVRQLYINMAYQVLCEDCCCTFPL